MSFPEQPPKNNEELELERTFLANRVPEEIVGVNPIPMEDTYIPEDLSVHAHLRVRRRGEKREITKKEVVNTGDASEMIEQTIPLTEAEFEALRLSSARRVEKDRYKVDIADRNGTPRSAEVDIFKGLLKGLVVIDFEFTSVEEKADFVPPECCGAEVTQADFIAGGVLAGLSYGDIAHHLDEYSYNKLTKD
ncbi:MAG: hypothetical protein ACOH18_00975 [Candidatus Saccharimonadaceae bacterium]